MFSDIISANNNGKSRRERMRAIQSAMDTRPYRCLIQEILDDIDQDEQEQYDLSNLPYPEMLRKSLATIEEILAVEPNHPPFRSIR
jgi:hypothetical protein